MEPVDDILLAIKLFFFVDGDPTDAKSFQVIIQAATLAYGCADSFSAAFVEQLENVGKANIALFF